MTNRAPLLAAIALLLLPVLYVGSYLALVSPWQAGLHRSFSFQHESEIHYRIGGRWAGVVFWPLEQLDRQLRPDAWDAEQQGWTTFPPE
jgi:hypothetical protein